MSPTRMATLGVWAFVVCLLFFFCFVFFLYFFFSCFCLFLFVLFVFVFVVVFFYCFFFLKNCSSIYFVNKNFVITCRPPTVVVRLSTPLTKFSSVSPGPGQTSCGALC